MRVNDIAKVCHEANRALTSIIKDVPDQPGWEFAAEDMRQSCIKGVAYALMHPEATPEQLHAKWCEEKILAGWTFGEIRNEAKKQHPALRPYEDLPLATRKKDALFRAVVAALAPNPEVMREAIEAAQAGEGSVDEQDDSESSAFRS